MAFSPDGQTIVSGSSD
ncbi:hypothetical protein, partial [Prochlorothrix hollandica]